MKAYGVPRHPDIVHPDLVDGRVYAVKSSKMRTTGKGEDHRSTFKSKQVKRNARRVWKKKERAAITQTIHKELS